VRIPILYRDSAGVLQRMFDQGKDRHVMTREAELGLPLDARIEGVIFVEDDVAPVVPKLAPVT
jgi:hypothetical protein